MAIRKLTLFELHFGTLGIGTGADIEQDADDVEIDEMDSDADEDSSRSIVPFVAVGLLAVAGAGAVAYRRLTGADEDLYEHDDIEFVDDEEEAYVD